MLCLGLLGVAGIMPILPFRMNVVCVPRFEPTKEKTKKTPVSSQFRPDIFKTSRLYVDCREKSGAQVQEPKAERKPKTQVIKRETQARIRSTTQISVCVRRLMQPWPERHGSIRGTQRYVFASPSQSGIPEPEILN